MKKFDTTISLRISKSAADKFRAIAFQQGRSASNLFREQMAKVISDESQLKEAIL